MFDHVLSHCPFLGHSGYANHAREFFTALNSKIPVRIRNFTHTNPIDYLTQQQKDMVIHQTWAEAPWEIGTPYNPNPKEKIINIILMETNHFYFYDNYKGPTIAYNVWESTRQPAAFFERLKTFDMVWVPTEWQRKCTIEQGLPAEKVFVVPEGVDIQKFQPRELSDTTPIFPDGRFKFMIFGRWDYRKYTTEMVRAFTETFDKNEPVDLLLSADNPFPVDSYHSTEERLEKYGLQDDRIKILHFPSDDEYVSYLQNGHVMLMVSRSEGWGLPAIEALSCGTPTLITNWGAPLEFGKEAAYTVKVKEFLKPKNVFMQKDSPGIWAEPDYEDLKIQMRYMYENYAECKEHTMKNIHHVRKFTWENASDIAMNILSNMDIQKYYPLKINVGSGEYPREGYINIDKFYKPADLEADALNLPYDDNSVDEVFSSHLLEHFNKTDVRKALEEWFRVLRINGKIELNVPNFESVLRKWLETDDKMGFHMDTIFGLQTRPGEEHKFGFTKNILKSMLFEIGFSDIDIQDIKSHGQDCFYAVAYKKELEYNDDVIIIDTYPNTKEKIDILRNSIKDAKMVNKPIAVVSHYPIPDDITKDIDYLIYDKNNPLSENYGLTYWMVMPKELKIVTSLTNSYHGLACLTSIKNGATFLRNKFKYAHFIESDVRANLKEYFKKVNYWRRREKKFICFDYHYVVPKQDGIITNFFSFDLAWLDDNMIEMKKWDDYVQEAYAICRRTGRMADMVLEHWIWNYFVDRDLMKDVHILPKSDKDECILRGNMLDMMNEEPEMQMRISETNDGQILVIIMRDDRVKNLAKYTLEHEGNIIKDAIAFDRMNYHLIPKRGTVKFTCDYFTKEIEIDPEKTYKETIFRFYDDRIKCIEWADEYDKDFMYSGTEASTDDKIIYTFNGEAKVEILGNTHNNYDIEFINSKTGLTVYKTNITPNHWCSPSPRYNVDWKINVRTDGKLVSSHDFDVKGRNVLIQTDSSALGDTIAWFPYLEEFRQQKGCTVYARTWHNKLFKAEYPGLKWLEPTQEPLVDIYAYYNIGCRDNDYNSNKNNWRSVPLQKVAADYLGIDYKEIRPKITKSIKERSIRDKYVAISEHSTFQCKYWLFPGGWQYIVEYLKSKGLKTMVVSKERTSLKGIINKTNNPMDETINNICHAELFIGVSSGPSWLAWGLDKPVVLISGYSAQWGEWQDNCARIISPPGKCGGCFNDRDAVLDRGNWGWCPRSKNFECTTSITPQMVIAGINKFI